MMLRSSSTPLLGSLLPSFSEGPNNHHHQSDLHGATPKHPPPSSIHQNCTKLSCTNGGSENVTRSSLTSPSVAEIKGSNGSAQNGFRRVQSEGNLDELVSASYNLDEFSFSDRCSRKFARKPNVCTLEAIPSVSLHNLGTSSKHDSDEDEEEEEEEEEKEDEEELEVKGDGNAFIAENLISEEVRTKMNAYSTGFEGEGKMYLATGFGFPGIGFVDGGGDGGRGNCRPVDFNRDGGESHGLGMEEHYKSMLEENPGNPLFMRNYAQFLYQTKGDLEGAEQYYSRAILADPGDGEILCQYAKLIWELHQDRERAAAYFQRAVQASSEDSHIQAAYANFLWDTEDEDDEDEDEGNAVGNSHLKPPLFHHGFIASATA